MRVKTFLDKNLVKEDFLKVLSKIEGFRLNISTKENNHRDLFITGFSNKEYECKITVNQLPAFAKGASVDEFNKAITTLDYKRLDKFVSDFWIEASYKSGGKEIKYRSESHVGNGSYMKFNELKELNPWKMEYKEILGLFKRNKLRIEEYTLFHGARMVSFTIGGLNNHSYDLSLRIQIEDSVVADFDKMREVHYLLTTGDYEGLEPYVKNHYFAGTCHDYNGRNNFPTNTHTEIKDRFYTYFDYTDNDLYTGENRKISIDRIESLLPRKNHKDSLSFSTMVKLLEEKGITISFGSTKNMSRCIVLELGGFTDSSKGILYAFLKEDSELCYDEICDCILNGEYEVVDDYIDIAFTFGYNSYQVVDSYSFGLDAEKVRDIFRKCSK